jgi:hypothetical protein
MVECAGNLGIINNNKKKHLDQIWPYIADLSHPQQRAREIFLELTT